MSLASFFGLGGKTKSPPAPLAAPSPPIVTTAATPPAPTAKEQLLAVVNAMPDDVEPAALLYVKDGKLTLSTHYVGPPYLIQMLGEATKFVGASLVSPPAA